MKFCEHCGEKLGKDEKFCSKCGKKVADGKLAESKSTSTGSKKESLGTASLVIGIISLVLSFIPIINLIALPLSLVGLILGIVNKAKKGKKIAGIILNVVAMLLSVIVFTISIFVFGFYAVNSTEGKDFTHRIENELDKVITLSEVQGTWNCRNYGSSNYVIRLDVNNNYTFKYGLYDSFNENYVTGTYDLDDDYISGSRYEIDLEGLEKYQNGVKQTLVDDPDYTLTVRKYGDSISATLVDDDTYKTYTCDKQ